MSGVGETRANRTKLPLQGPSLGERFKGYVDWAGAGQKPASSKPIGRLATGARTPAYDVPQVDQYSATSIEQNKELMLTNTILTICERNGIPVSQLTDENFKKLVVLYISLAFTVTRIEDIEGGKRTPKDFYSPFWKKDFNGENEPTGNASFTSLLYRYMVHIIDTFMRRTETDPRDRELARSAASESVTDRPMETLDVFELYEGTNYGEEDDAETRTKIQYRKFCDKTFDAMLKWFVKYFPTDTRAGPMYVISDFVKKIVGRSGALQLRKKDQVGTSLSFALVRPIIGRYLNKEFFTVI